MASQKEVAESLKALSATISKIGTETSGLKQKVADLQAAVDNQQNASPELVEAVEALQAQLKVVDDLVEDAAPTEPTPPPTEG